jgi:hypothetical protein
MQQLSLSLSLVSDKRIFLKNDLPDVKVRLKNESNQKVVVNGRMLLVPAGSPPQIEEVTFSITGPSGSINLQTFRVNAGAAGIEYFVSLLPGAYIDKVYELKEFFYYDKAGQYKVRAKYHNEIDCEKIGIRSWKGELISNEEYFEII